MTSSALYLPFIIAPNGENDVMNETDVNYVNGYYVKANTNLADKIQVLTE